MNKQDFIFDLPESAIAAVPCAKRDESRLLCPSAAKIEDLHFKDILDKLNPGDLLVLNESKVVPARIYGHKLSGGRVEILLERVIDSRQAKVFMRTSKKLKPGTKIILAANVSINVLDFNANLGIYTINFNDLPDGIFAFFAKHGHIPLPPYIKRAATKADVAQYQTVYARTEGSFAAPTAGLHFTDELLEAIAAKGVNIAKLILHVGAGTFLPVRVDNIAEHKMHSEYVEVSSELVAAIDATKAQGGQVIAVGTTTTRALEAAATSGNLAPFKGETDIFIRPGYKFQIIDKLITNFHLPGSTLLMLVAAFVGLENMQAYYAHAIQHNYRFYSYGDAMLLTKVE